MCFVVAFDVQVIMSHTEEGNKKVMDIIYNLTCFVRAVSTLNETIETLAQVLIDSWFSTFVQIERLISDLGPSLQRSVGNKSGTSTGYKEAYCLLNSSTSRRNCREIEQSISACYC